MSSSPYNPLGPAHYTPPNQGVELQTNPAKRVAVFFATREGHAQQIAERIMADLRNHGFDVDIHDVRRPLQFALSHYAAAVLAASVHAGDHEREMIQFVKDHRTELSRIPTAFISVTLSEAGAQRTDATPSEHAQFVADVDKMMNKFFEETEWRPEYAKPVAGALLYSKYNFLLRFIMKRIAKKAGASTDTSQDYDFTDWADLDHFIDEFAPEVHGSAVPVDPSGGDAEFTAGGRIASHV